MGRTRIQPLVQPTEVSCGPVSIRHALEIFGKRKSLTSLVSLCKTTRNGTSSKNMIRALNALGLSVMAIEKANLKHLLSALKHSPTKPRAVIVNYLYSGQKEDPEWKKTGHWAMVSSYSASRNRIVLFDSYYGKRKSYSWPDFRKQWMEFDLKRQRLPGKRNTFRYVKKWQRQMALIIAKDSAHLPKFRLPTSQVFPAVIPVH